jgi:Raf kinase inhibitor-like YbhB/YbcL family protein
MLIMDDPDAPSRTFRHWGMHEIHPGQSELREWVGVEGEMRRQAVNDFGDARYDGPLPPAGHGVHHYHFRIAALDVARLDIPVGAGVKTAWDIAGPHVIEQAELVGPYAR